MQTSFETIIKAFGNNTGIIVPEEKLLELDAGKKPPVKVSIGTYEYQSTVASMNGMFLIPLAKEHRERLGLKGDDRISITLTLEEKGRAIEIPSVLKEALIKQKSLESFESLSYSVRKEYVRQILDAKKEETLVKRLDKILKSLE